MAADNENISKAFDCISNILKDESDKAADEKTSPITITIHFLSSKKVTLDVINNETVRELNIRLTGVCGGYIPETDTCLYALLQNGCVKNCAENRHELVSSVFDLTMPVYAPYYGFNPTQEAMMRGNTRDDVREINTECPVCLESFVFGLNFKNTIIATICNHRFHLCCLKGSKLCPLCREPINDNIQKLAISI
jgi:hypothetical protein